MLDKVTDLLLFFGKLLVVGGVGKGKEKTQDSEKCVQTVFKVSGLINYIFNANTCSGFN